MYLVLTLQKKVVYTLIQVANCMFIINIARGHITIPLLANLKFIEFNIIELMMRMVVKK
jgi:hypothetical protein